MKKTSHQDDLVRVKGLRDKWLFLIYGDPLYKSEAVAVLELQRFNLQAFPDDDRKDEAISEPLRKSLRNFDHGFFRDLAAAMEAVESSERKLINHFKVMKYIMHYLPVLDSKMSGFLEVERKEIGYDDLEKIAPGGDISTIVRDLGLVELGLVKKAKPGRKSKKP